MGTATPHACTSYCGVPNAGYERAAPLYVYPSAYCRLPCQCTHFASHVLPVCGVGQTRYRRHVTQQRGVFGVMLRLALGGTRSRQKFLQFFREAEIYLNLSPEDVIREFRAKW